MHPEWDGVVPPATRTKALRITRGLFWSENCESNQDIMRPVYWEMNQKEAVVVMQKLVDSQVGGFTPDCQHNRPLRWASRNGHVEVVKLLLSVCGDVDPTIAGPVLAAEGDDNIVPILNIRNALNSLEIACAYGRYQIAEILLQDSRVTKEACDKAYHFGSLKKDSSPFGRNYAHVIRVLLEDGRAEPALPTRHYYYADAVEFLLEDGRCPIPNDGHALMNAAETGNLRMLKYYHEMNPNTPLFGGLFPVVPAAQHGQVHIMEYLLSFPEIDPSVRNNDAIRQASANGHSEIVRMLLLDPRVDPSTPGVAKIFSAGRYYELQDFQKTALHMAIRGGHGDVIRLLLADKRTDVLPDMAKYPDTVMDDGTSTVMTVYYGRDGDFGAAMARGKIIQTVLERDDVRRADPFLSSNTPKLMDNLELAIEMGSVVVVGLLLDDNRMVDHIRANGSEQRSSHESEMKRGNGCFYLNLAEEKGQLEIAELLKTRLLS
ncbi:ankyrin repeat-containing domain protein [Obelidium mucronatum]|nr:ankyrin repeat-containing domain protein [Obelidium mucronatum]